MFAGGEGGSKVYILSRKSPEAVEVNTCDIGLPSIPTEEAFKRFPKRWSVAACTVGEEIPEGVQLNSLDLCIPAGKAKPADLCTRFKNEYRRVAQQYRRELVKEELNRTTIMRITTNLNDYKLNPAQKQMLADIFDLGRTMETTYQKQRGALAYKKEVETKGTAVDREFYRRYQTVWCDDLSNPYCNASPSLPKFSTPLYPDGFDCAKEMVGELTNPFSVVRYDVTGKLRAIPYAEDPELKYLQGVAAVQANKSAESARKAGEESIACYLEEVALALQNKKPFPYAKADEAWIASKNSRFYLRVGADEYQADVTCGTRAQFHMVVGIKDLAAEKNIGGFVSQKQKYEEYLAKLAPGYKTREITIETPDFMSMLMEFGEARGNTKGTAVGQTLPNWCGVDGEGKNCSSRIMIFTNKTQKAYSKKFLEAFSKIFSKNVMEQLDMDEVLNTIVHHELAHNLGPQTKDNTKGLGDMAGRMEELKAEVGALALRPILEETGQANPEKRKSAYAGLLVWAIGHIRRSAHRGEKFHETKSPYQQLAGVIVGHFTEKGALTFENGSWDINYDKCQPAADSLYTELSAVYLKGDRQAVADYFMRYTSGAGLTALHLNRIKETVAKVPSTLFDYRVVGWGNAKQKGSDFASRRNLVIDGVVVHRSGVTLSQ